MRIIVGNNLIAYIHAVGRSQSKCDAHGLMVADVVSFKLIKLFEKKNIDQ